LILGFFAFRRAGVASNPGLLIRTKAIAGGGYGGIEKIQIILPARKTLELLTKMIRMQAKKKCRT